VSNPLDTALKLLKLGYWAIAIYPRGAAIKTKRGDKTAEGKEPIGKGWGAERWTEERLRAEHGRRPGAGAGVCFGPGRGPGGSWLIDLEGDGPGAAESLAKLLGGEIPETPSWGSTRGDHTLFTADGERLLSLLSAAGAKEGTGTKAGVYHLDLLPGLEFRVGGFKADGATVKQVQSVVPPTPGTNGAPRAWKVTPKTPPGPLPESAYAFLQRIPAESRRAYGQAALEREAAEFARKPAGERHGYLLGCTVRLASLVKAGALTEGEVLQALHAAARSNGMAAEGRAAEVDELWATAMGMANPRKIRDRSPNPATAGRDGTAPSGTGRGERDTQAEVLLRLADVATLFHDPAGRAYAAVPVGSHIEVHAVRSTGFALWLKRQFYTEETKPPSAQPYQDALGVIEARAIFDGPEEPVFIRVAGDADRIFIDLGGADWRAVRIDAAGWCTTSNPPVRFRRPAGLKALPTPERGGSIDRLRDFANIDPAEFLLFVAWLAAALRPSGPYPILVLTGEQGSAKSTLARLARCLIDPHVSLLRSEPREPRDLMIGAANGWMVAIDNISTMVAWRSDGLCRLSTGGGYATRKLYSDDEETFLDAMRPVILNGITDFVARGDLIDRAQFLHLPVIPEDKRRAETEFWRDFDAEAPRLLGALLDAVAGGLRELPNVQLAGKPRMADYALFGEAVSRGLGRPAEEFLEVYRDNRKAANESALEDSPVAGAVRELASRGPWTGTATELLDELADIVGEKVAKSKRWHKSPRGMSGAIRRLAPSLRMVGVLVDFGERTNKARPITIDLAERRGIQPSPPSPPSLKPINPLPDVDIRRDRCDDGPNGQPSPATPTVTQPSLNRHSGNPHGDKDLGDPRDDGDDGDGWIPTLSAGPDQDRPGDGEFEEGDI
jgi:hypothetical protein